MTCYHKESELILITDMGGKYNDVFLCGECKCIIARKKRSTG